MPTLSSTGMKHKASCVDLLTLEPMSTPVPRVTHVNPCAKIACVLYERRDTSASSATTVSTARPGIMEARGSNSRGGLRADAALIRILPDAHNLNQQAQRILELFQATERAVTLAGCPICRHDRARARYGACASPRPTSPQGYGVPSHAFCCTVPRRRGLIN